MKILRITMNTLFILLALGCVLLFLLPSMPLLGHTELKIVQSGSMEPGIKTGSIVFIREQPAYGVGDIVTFVRRGTDVPTTHRIIDVEESELGRSFITKGDANEERDVDVAPESLVIGKVLFAIPYVGFLLDFARQPLGSALLIGVPAFLIIIDEVEKIWSAFRIRRREAAYDQDDDDDTKPETPVLPHSEVVRTTVHHDVRPPVKEVRSVAVPMAAPLYSARMKARISTIGVVVGALVMTSGMSVGDTVSYFRDIESTIDNLLGAEAVDFTLEADTTTFVVRDGVVVDPDGQLIVTIQPTDLSTHLEYRVESTVYSGDAAFCAALTGASVVPFTYSGSLAGLSSPGTTTFDGFGGAWSVGLGFDETASGTPFAPGATCMITFTVTGWDSTRDESSSRFVDTESLTLTFAVDGDLLAARALNAFMLSEADVDTAPTTIELGTTTEEEVASTTEETKEVSSGETTEPTDTPAAPEGETPPPPEVSAITETVTEAPLVEETSVETASPEGEAAIPPVAHD